MARMRAPERRRQLLEVAATLFAERGYRGTTTAELAAAAGVTEPILYRHFDNKRDLFVTLIEMVGEQVIEAWEEALAGVEEPAERLRVLLDGNPATHPRGRDVYRVIFRAMNEQAEEPAIGPALKRHITQLHAFMRDELRELQQRGAVRDDEPAETIASMLVSTAIGYAMVTPFARPRGGGRQRVADLLRELLAAE